MEKFVLVILLLLLCPNPLLAYDNVVSHPKITEESIRKSGSEYDIDNYLRTKLGFKDGFNTKLTKLGVVDSSRTITEWLKKGSADEDKPACRASNHFHDPTYNAPH